MNHLGIFLLLVAVAAAAHAYRYADRSVADANGAFDKSVRSPADTDKIVRSPAAAKKVVLAGIKRYAREPYRYAYAERSVLDGSNVFDKSVRSPADIGKWSRAVPANQKTAGIKRYAREPYRYAYAERSVLDGSNVFDKSVRSPADTDKILRSPADTDKIVRSPAAAKKVVPAGIKRNARQECAPAGTPCDYLGRGSGGFTNCCSKMCMQQASDPVGGGHCT